MNKLDAVASLGQDALLQPARMRAALDANDRLKLYLTVLQAAAAHAAAPGAPPAGPVARNRCRRNQRA